MSEIEGYACDRSGSLIPTRCRSSNGEECMCWPKIAKPAQPAGDRIVNGFVILDGMAFSKEEILTQRIALCDALDAADKLTAERDQILVERDGANERAGILLKAKDEWAERARATESDLDQARRTAEHWKAEHLAGNAVIDQLRAEVERLTGCLHRANQQAEHFEREWYLRGDEVEALRDAAKFASVVMGVVARNNALAEVERRSLLCEVRRCDAALAAKDGGAQ